MQRDVFGKLSKYGEKVERLARSIVSEHPGRLSARTEAHDRLIRSYDGLWGDVYSRVLDLTNGPEFD